MITIVSGLPRSGTSLMMQMLAAGGAPILSDGQRKPDTDNPRGYLEWERIKKLPKDPTCIDETEGKVVKVISYLLPALPPNHQYRVIFMQRPLAEVLKSQEEMLKRRGTFDSPDSSSTSVKDAFEEHLIEVERWLRSQPNLTVLHVHYHSLLQDPEATARAVADFLNLPLNIDLNIDSKIDLNIEKMTAEVDPNLYRNRAT
jgi:hypothetical protein